MAVRHLVLIRFKSSASAADIATVERAFCGLKDQIACVRDMEWGTNVSPEGLNKGFTHSFLLSFAHEADRDAYLPHPAHQAFVEQLKPVLEDVLVIDYLLSL